MPRSGLKELAGSAVSMGARTPIRSVCATAGAAARAMSKQAASRRRIRSILSRRAILAARAKLRQAPLPRVPPLVDRIERPVVGDAGRHDRAGERDHPPLLQPGDRERGLLGRPAEAVG